MRIQGLDFIRGVAVLLVLFRHTNDVNVLQRIGWVGVDLFFVLSGFLIGSLVLNEFSSKGAFNAKRFFIRRAFKIYPAFYFFLFVSLAVNFFEHDLTYEPRFIIAEIFFLQSYLPHVWTHTWSIAVEEHFYLAVAIIAAWRIRKLSAHGNRFLLWMFLLLVFAFISRFIICFPKRHHEFAFFSTHLRMDGIIVGFVCAYLKRVRNFDTILMKYTWLFLASALLLISPPFFASGGSFFMNTIGLTSMNLGFGIIVLFATQIQRFDFSNKNILINFLPLVVAFVGVHSYSIYLWHLFVGQELYRFGLSGISATFAYIVMSLMVGIFFSYVLEKPILVLRERFFN